MGKITYTNLIVSCLISTVAGLTVNTVWASDVLVILGVGGLTLIFIRLLVKYRSGRQNGFHT